MRIKRKQTLAMWRRLAGLSQQEFADKLNVTRATVSSWENGTLPRSENIVKIEQVLNIKFFDDVIMPKE